MTNGGVVPARRPALVPQKPRRSCLSVPGHASRMHEKALSLAADETVFDLEDAVAPGAKAQAREAVAATLARAEWAGRMVAIRINAVGSKECHDDLALVRELALRIELTAVVPKVQSGDELVEVANRLDDAVGLQALIETPAGIEAAPQIACSTPRLRALILGYADLASALGRRGAERHIDRWLYHQEAVLAAARIAGLHAIDGPFLLLGDPVALGRAARVARGLGYDGKWAIHPDQVPVLNQVFAASDAELRWAGKVQDSLAEAAQSGDAAVRVDGAMVDEAMRAHADRLHALPRRAPPSARLQLTGSPFYEDLAVGQSVRAPGVTITDGLAAVRQAIVGDLLRLPLDAPLCREVTGAPSVLAHPSLVCDLAMRQSTYPSGRWLGNLFVRGLAVRPVHVGATLRTTSEAVAKGRVTSAGRGTRGMVLLHVTARDEAEQIVLQCHRCAQLPARGNDTGEVGDDVMAASDAIAEPDVHELVPRDWRLDALRRQPLGPVFAELDAGKTWTVELGETVVSAPEVAMTHTDAIDGAHGRRLVHGGQVIGVASAHLTRVLPDVATILAWRSWDHLGPTYEGDRLRSQIALERLEPLHDGGLVYARILVLAAFDDEDVPRRVLDWRLTALCRNRVAWCLHYALEPSRMHHRRRTCIRFVGRISVVRPLRMLAGVFAMPASRPLEGIRVVGLEHSVAGPLCTRILGDMGADVIKVERPGAGDFSRHWDHNANGEGAQFWWLNRGKRSIALDLKDSDDRAVFERLLDRADVLVHNLSPAAAERLGLADPSLDERFPSLVSCQISGYGNSGPLRDRKAYDMLVQAESGIMSVTGTPTHPSRAGVSVCDVGTGMYAAALVLGAVIEQRRTGRGRRLDIAMMDAALEFVAPMLMSYANAGVVYERLPQRHHAIAPYGVFYCRDGEGVLIAVEQNSEWRLVCERLLGDATLADDPRYSTNAARITHREAVDHMVADAVGALDFGAMTAVFDEMNLAYGALNSMAEVATHSVLRDRGALRTVAGRGDRQVDTVIGVGERLFAAASEPGAPPELDQHREAILDEVGRGHHEGAPA